MAPAGAAAAAYPSHKKHIFSLCLNSAAITYLDVDVRNACVEYCHPPQEGRIVVNCFPIVVK